MDDNKETFEKKRDRLAKKLATIYADCRDGKYSWVNSTEWRRSHDGCLEGVRFGWDACREQMQAELKELEYFNRKKTEFSGWANLKYCIEMAEQYKESIKPVEKK